MNKLFIATTLDGYIATENDSIEWLEKHNTDVCMGSAMKNLGNFLKTANNVVMGFNTYKVGSENYPTAFGELQVYVVSSREYDFASHVKVISMDEALNLEGNTFVVGGSGIIESYIKNNLLDQIELLVIPTMIGRGKKMINVDFYNDFKHVSSLENGAQIFQWLKDQNA